VVASDAHNLGGRKPMMSEARSYLVKHWGAERARAMTYLTPAQLCGLALPR
jgi:tyrosine-protein phosphatase YwqE